MVRLRELASLVGSFRGNPEELTSQQVEVDIDSVWANVGWLANYHRVELTELASLLMGLKNYPQLEELVDDGECLMNYCLHH